MRHQREQHSQQLPLWQSMSSLRSERCDYRFDPSANAFCVDKVTTC